MPIRRSLPLLAITGALMAVCRPADAQTTRITLQQALDLGLAHSNPLQATRAAEQRAEAEEQQVRGLFLPQVGLTTTYTRTLASEFSGVFGPGGGDGESGGINFNKLPFGQKNIYQVAFAFSQAIYTGGRLSAQRAQAGFSRQSAALVTTGAQAQVMLDITQAFYNAALSDRLVTIAESNFEQASAASDQVKLAYDAGRQPEFELLRAQVARDNQRPPLIRARADREVAYLRLRQLLDLPAGTPLDLEADFDQADLPPPAPFAEALAAARKNGPPEDRASVREAETVVALRETSVSAAHAERLPQAALNSALSRVGYPSTGVVPGVGDFRTNWSLSATLQMPLLTGGRLKAGEAAARASLAQAEAELKQTRELSAVDSATAVEDLAAAEAALEASAGTVGQAQRAYEIAELRNREGLSTQLELNDARVALLFAQVNRAQTARDVQVARARVALLANLPLGVR